MFKSKKNLDVTTQIGHGENFKGVLASTGVVRVSGQVVGKVVGKEGRIPELVIIEPDAHFQGQLIARDVIIKGTFEGKCIGHHVTIAGDVTGAVFYDGSFNINSSRARVNFTLISRPLSNTDIYGDEIDSIDAGGVSDVVIMKPAKMA
jgi:hypothetical protein